MNSFLFVAPTYICLFCRYTQDTDPYNIYQQSPEMFPNTPLGECPNCFAQGRHTPLTKHNDTPDGSQTQVRVASDDELSEMKVLDTDANGQPIMEESGEVRYQFDPMTGQITPVSILQPKMRSLTTQELAELKHQRDQNLDALESIAVKEV